jgi:hypothetical protein
VLAGLCAIGPVDDNGNRGVAVAADDQVAFQPSALNPAARGHPAGRTPRQAAAPMTPGGINQRLLTDLRRDGVPDPVRRALDRIQARLRE